MADTQKAIPEAALQAANSLYSPPASRISALKEFPRELDLEDIRKHVNGTSPGGFVSFSVSGWHESLMRSYQTLQYVKEMLELNTPASVILEIIKEVGE